MTAGLGANLNINFNVQDILMSKFGVSFDGSQGRSGGNRSLDGRHQGRGGAANRLGSSITKQIFVNDARQQAVLPLETTNQNAK